MAGEVPPSRWMISAATQQYIDGKLEQVWRREDGKGGVLLFGTSRA